MNVLIVVSTSLLLAVTFVYDLALYGHPEHHTRSFTLASTYLILMTPMLLRNMRLWQKVNDYCHEHLVLMSSALTFKRVQVVHEAGAAGEATVIAALTKFMEMHDYKARCIGMKITVRLLLLFTVVILLGVGSLVYRWLRLLFDDNNSSITVTLSLA